MDTNKILNDTVSEIITEQMQTATSNSQPLTIFIWGVLGVFLFVVFYMLIVKITAIISKKIKENK